MNTVRRFSYRRFALASLAMWTAGCTVEQTQGDTTIFTYAAWTPYATFAAGVVGFLVGVQIRPRWGRFGWMLIILGPLACLFLAPSFFLDRITVNPQGFTLRTGFWFSPTVHDVKFRDLARIELATEETTGRRGRREKHYYFLCEKKSGGVDKVPLGDLMRSGASHKIAEVAHKEGIPVVRRE
jgi:hypothetical protein